MSHNRKRIVFLCLMLLIGGGWISIAARSQDQKAQPATEQNRSLLADPNLAGSPDMPLGGKGLFARMMLCIVLVAGLGVGLMYVSRKVLPRVANSPNKEIRIRETTYLGPRKALHLVDVGNHRLLIGSTNDNITALADVTDTWLDATKQETDETVKL